MEAPKVERATVIPSSGLTIVHDRDEVYLDIVFVHGLTGHPEQTWLYTGAAPHYGEDDGQHDVPASSSRTRRFSLFSKRQQKEVSVYWPRDLLPSTVPNAQVLTYGYDTHIRHRFGGQINKSSIYDMSWDLLVALEGHRREFPSRPVIFVAHSLGGIVVKEMLRRSTRCKNHQDHLSQISEATVGIMFFGTPHFGSDPRNFVHHVVEKMVKVAGFSASEQVVNALLPSSERLKELRDEFGPIAIDHGYIIHSFQEQYGIAALNGRKVVDDSSSSLDLPSAEVTEHIARNHMEMCRFSGLKDIEYRKVASALHRMTVRISEIKQGPELLDDKRLKALRAQLKSSLKFERIDARFEAISDPQQKTCQWLFDKSEYTEWLDPEYLCLHHGVLWIKGKPGTGKSTLTKYAVSHALEASNGEVIIYYFFNARGDTFEKSIVGMYRSLLLQLLDQVPELEVVFDNFARKNYFPDWSLRDLCPLFEDAIQKLPSERRMVCYIDALDECDEEEIRSMLDFWDQLANRSPPEEIKFRLWFSSRHYPHISVDHCLGFTLEHQDEHTQDIEKYLGARLKIGEGKLAAVVRTEMLRRASGIFMWVVLVVHILNREYDKGRIHSLQQRLQEIPSNLHELFRDILTRDTDNREELLMCLQWVLYANRTLTPRELYFGILTGIGTDLVSFCGWNADGINRRTIRRFILDSSKGLVEIIATSGTRTVQFIHESVKDFLVKEDGLREVWLHLNQNSGNSLHGQSHDRLKECCQRYMVFDVMERETEKNQSRLSPPSLFDYSLKNILYHADEAQGAGVSQNVFLRGFPTSTWPIMFQRKKYRSRGPRSLDWLYVLIKRQCPHLIEAVEWRYSAFDTTSEEEETLLRAAFRRGHTQTIAAVIKSEARRYSLDSPFQESAASFCDKLRTQSHFYQEGCLYNKYKLGTILFDAARDSDLALLSLLLDSGRFDVNKSDAYGRTVLGAATQSVECVDVLLSMQGINVNCQDQMGQTPLFAPSIGGRADIVSRLLSAPNILVDFKNRFGRTALSEAAGTWMQQTEIIRLLLDSGKVDPDSRDQEGRTPLSYAAEWGHAQVISLLLATGKVDADSRDLEGLCPLRWALQTLEEGKMEQTCLVLLESGNANPLITDNRGRSTLYAAKKLGLTNIVDMFVSHLKGAG